MASGHDHDHDHGDGVPGGLVVNQDEELSPWPHSSTDPTATKTIRKQYSGEMYRRFRALKGAIRTTLVENDALALIEGRGRAVPQAERSDEFAAEVERDLAALADPGINIEAAGPNDFDFPSDADKIDGFNDWLNTQVDRGILEAQFRGREVAAADPWQNVYLRSSYEKGVSHADAALVEQGVIPPDQTLDDVFRATKHADAVGMIYTRAYNELDGVTNAMGQEISRELAEGLTQGENPRKIARRLNDRVDNVGIHRGRMVARTETIRAHNEAALNRYEDVENRIGGVALKAEHVTAGDRRVCVICQTLAGTTYTLDEARGRIPVHPNCRCTWVPLRKGQQAPDERPVRLKRRAEETLHDASLQGAEKAEAVGDVIEDELGIPTEGFGELNGFQARGIVNALARLDRAGELADEKIPDSIDLRIKAARQGTDALDEMSGAHADYEFGEGGGRLRVNPYSWTRSNTEDAMDSGWLYGDIEDVDPFERTFVHEWGHMRHQAALEQADDVDDAIRWVQGYSLDDDEIYAARKHISDYSSENGFEFVAESYTKKAFEGEDLPTDTIGISNLQNLYRDGLRGPEVDELPPVPDVDVEANVRVNRGDRVDRDMGSNQGEPDEELPEFLRAERNNIVDSVDAWLDQLEDDEE